MPFYQSPLKNRSAATLSFLLGLVTIAAIAFGIRVREDEKRLSETEQTVETLPIDASFSETQSAISKDREHKLGTLPAEEKTVTETKPVTTTTTVPAPVQPAPKKSAPKTDRTTRTS